MAETTDHHLMLVRAKLVTGLAIFAATISIAWAETKPTVGMLLKNRVGYWALVEKGAIAAGNDLGVTVVVKGAPSVSNPAWQVSLLQTLLEQKMDALVISPVNPELLESYVKTAMDRGIKVVAFDAPSWRETVNISLEPDRVEMAKVAARIFASLVNDGDDVVVFRNNQSDLPVVQREEILVAEIKALQPNLVIRTDIYASNGGGDAREPAAFALKKYPATKAVLSTSTAGTMAMLDILVAKGLAGKVKLVGFGTNLNPQVAAAISSGEMSGWIAQLPYDLGYMCIANAVSAIRGKGNLKGVIVKETSLLVTRENIHDPKVQGLLKL